MFLLIPRGLPNGLSIDFIDALQRSIITQNGFAKVRVSWSNKHETSKCLGHYVLTWGVPLVSSLSVLIICLKTPKKPRKNLERETNPNSSSTIGCVQLTAWLWRSKRNRDLESKVKASAWQGRMTCLFLP